MNLLYFCRKTKWKYNKKKKKSPIFIQTIVNSKHTIQNKIIKKTFKQFMLLPVITYLLIGIGILREFNGSQCYSQSKFSILFCTYFTYRMNLHGSLLIFHLLFVSLKLARGSVYLILFNIFHKCYVCVCASVYCDNQCRKERLHVLKNSQYFLFMILMRTIS